MCIRDSSCHEDVLWIGPADRQVIRGRKNLVDAFHAEKHELKFSLNNLTVLPLATTSSTVAEIMTFMLVDTISVSYTHLGRRIKEKNK